MRDLYLFMTHCFSQGPYFESDLLLVFWEASDLLHPIEKQYVLFSDDDVGSLQFVRDQAKLIF